MPMLAMWTRKQSAFEIRHYSVLQTMDSSLRATDPKDMQVGKFQSENSCTLIHIEN